MPAMLPIFIVSIVMAVIAAGFFYIGNTKYNAKGMFFAVLSILLGWTALTFLPGYGWYGLVGVNVVLYLVILAVTALRGKK